MPDKRPAVLRGAMNKALRLAKWGSTLGAQPQNFLGAAWVRRLLDRSSPEGKRRWALRMLSLSPHYFIDPDNPKYRGLGYDDYLEAAFAEYTESRKQIYNRLLKDRVQPSDTLIDYGCGPGFLSKIASENINKVYGCDISQGALACARILNSSSNLQFVAADPDGLASIPDQSVDVVFSYAMIQHLSNEVYVRVLETCRRKLKTGGNIIFHVVAMDPTWRTEEEWRSDRSITGRIKFRYGLHCFSRTEQDHILLLEEGGFTDPKISSLSELTVEDSDDIDAQALVIATKPADSN